MMDITDDEIEYMKKTVGRGKYGYNEIWKKAFQYYNQNNDKKLSTECFPCYGKVLNYCIQAKKLSDDKISTNSNNLAT